MESSPVSRKWVLVAGTGSFELKDPELWCAEHVPCELVREGYGLVVGGWKGVDHVTARAFATELARISPEAALSSRLVQVLPRGHQPDFPGGHLIYVEPGPLEWVEALRYANAAILIGGLGGTYETYVFATQERKPVLPIAGTGGDAERALTDILSKWREIGTWGVKYENFKSTLSQSIESRSDAQSVSKLIARLLYDHFA